MNTVKDPALTPITFLPRVAAEFGLYPTIIWCDLADRIAKEGYAVPIADDDGIQRDACHKWVRISMKEWQERLPFLSKNQISDAIDSLVAERVVFYANLNENKMDKTRWYTVAQEFPTEA